MLGPRLTYTPSQYPLMDGPTLGRELLRLGNRTWFRPPGPTETMPSDQDNRFITYGLACSADRTLEWRKGRRFWLGDLVSEDFLQTCTNNDNTQSHSNTILNPEIIIPLLPLKTACPNQTCTREPTAHDIVITGPLKYAFDGIACFMRPPQYHRASKPCIFVTIIVFNLHNLMQKAAIFRH